MEIERKKSTQRRKLTPIMLILILLALLMIIRGIMYQPQITENYDKMSELEAQIEYEQKRADEVDALKENVNTDEYIEKIAREKLGMIKRDEILFIDISGEE